MDGFDYGDYYTNFSRLGFSHTSYVMSSFSVTKIRYDTIRYDTIGEFNVDSKAEYSA